MKCCIISKVFIVLNDRDGTESKYPSFVFLSIYCSLTTFYMAPLLKSVQYNSLALHLHRDILHTDITAFYQLQSGF